MPSSMGQEYAKRLRDALEEGNAAEDRKIMEQSMRIRNNDIPQVIENIIKDVGLKCRDRFRLSLQKPKPYKPKGTLQEQMAKMRHHNRTGQRT